MIDDDGRASSPTLRENRGQLNTGENSKSQSVSRQHFFHFSCLNISPPLPSFTSKQYNLPYLDWRARSECARAYLYLAIGGTPRRRIDESQPYGRTYRAVTRRSGLNTLGISADRSAITSRRRRRRRVDVRQRRRGNVKPEEANAYTARRTSIAIVGNHLRVQVHS